MSSAIKAIIFDCFGVLTTDTWWEFLNNLPPRADIEKARQAHRAYDAGLISKAESSRAIKQATGQEFIEMEDRGADKFNKNQALLSYIKELRRRGYKIGLLSNASSNWIRDRFLTPEEQKLFDDFVLSYEMGVTKPESRMFNLAVQRLDAKVEEAVLVDDKASYCREAEKNGLKAVEYKDFKQFKEELEDLLKN